MGNNPHPINAVDFLSALPPFYARGPEGEESLFRTFLLQFEEMFDGLQAALAGDAVALTYKSAEPDKDTYNPALNGYPLVVEPFDTGRLAYPKGSYVFIPGNPRSTLLAEPIGANRQNIDLINVTGKHFIKDLKPGMRFTLRTSSGLAGLTAIRETPPAAFANLGDPDKLAYLRYLASWVGLPVRADKTVSWNRRFLREAVALDNDPATLRSTLPGIAALLNAWHKEEIDAGETVVTDLVSPENGVDSVFRIGGSRVGVDTLLGEGEAGRFHVYLTADPNDVSMRHPRKLDAMIKAARLILDMEKRVNTEYALHIRASTMQIAPDAPIAPYKSANVQDTRTIPEEDLLAVKDTNTFARIGVTTLLWG